MTVDVQFMFVYWASIASQLYKENLQDGTTWYCLMCDLVVMQGKLMCQYVLGPGAICRPIDHCFMDNRLVLWFNC